LKLLRLWIEGLDEMLGGGLPDKSVVVMTGEPGSGYDILAQQIMYQHALRNERVAYFSTSRSPDTIKEDFSTFGWDIAPLQEKGNWVYYQTSVADAIQTLTENIPKAIAEDRWILLDSLSYLILGGIHFLLLTQKMHDTETETTMQHLADGVMEFTANETAGGIDRRIRLKKMRRAVYEPRLIPFNITERGITIETAVRIV